MTEQNHAQIVFVYGALRSGTTAFRLMLDAHPDTANPGEYDFLFDHLRRDHTHATGWRVDLDALQSDRIFSSSGLTLPRQNVPLDGLDLIHAFFDQLRARAPEARVITLNVHRNCRRIHDALPDAKFIHLIRDPRDVARSSIPMGWAAHIYYGVDHWIETERDWGMISTLIQPENQFELRYESLFSDWETELKLVCDFLNVPWSPLMLTYHEHTSYAAPDPKLIEQWRQKCSTDALALLEGKVGDLMNARGYVCATTPRTPTRSERITLAANHKIYRWRFGTQAYGPVLFFGEKVSRRIGLRGVHRRITAQISDLHKHSLK